MEVLLARGDLLAALRFFARHKDISVPVRDNKTTFREFLIVNNRFLSVRLKDF
jgi:hypothetical protein